MSIVNNNLNRIDIITSYLEPLTLSALSKGQSSPNSQIVKTISDVFAKDRESISTSSKPFKTQTVPSAFWWQPVLDLIVQVKKDCTPEQVKEFERLIRANKGHLNDQCLEFECTIFHTLAKAGTPLAFVEVLARNGMDFGVQDEINNTALLWAIANGKNAMVKEILQQLPAEQRSVLDKQCERGNTPLHLLIGKGYTNRTFMGETVTCSNFELMKSILELGADVNLQDEHGNTPLHLAYARRDLRMVNLLLEHGADRNVENDAKQKPKDLAKMGDDEDANFAKATALMDKTTDSYFLLDESQYKNAENLKAIMQL